MSQISLSMKKIALNFEQAFFQAQTSCSEFYFSCDIFHLFVEMGFDLSAFDSECMKEKCFIEIQQVESDSVGGWSRIIVVDKSEMTRKLWKRATITR